jgi:hypothetical protein
MAVRMGPRLQYTLDAPDDLLPHPVPPLLLQPLVENAIRHGLEPRVEGGQITVRARPDGRHLLIEVTDTGVGMDPATTASAEGGFGLAQVRERVASLGSGSSAGQVQVQSQPGQGTTVRLKLPLQQPRDSMNATALIAEDEPLLAAALQAELARAWPACTSWPRWATAPARCNRRWRCARSCCSWTSACPA